MKDGIQREKEVQVKDRESYEKMEKSHEVLVKFSLIIII